MLELLDGDTLKMFKAYGNVSHEECVVFFFFFFFFTAQYKNMFGLYRKHNLLGGGNKVSNKTGGICNQ